MHFRIASCSLAVSAAFGMAPFGASAAPTVYFATPGNGATISGSISQSSACEVRGSNIRRVRFYLDSTALNTEGESPWTCNIDTRQFSDGSHTLRAVAYDSAGASRSTQISVNIRNSTSSGSVSFKSPAANGTLSGSISASSACEVAGSNINGVQFYLDGTALNKEGSAPWTCNIDTTKFADGAHTLKAVATYSDGKTGTTQVAVNIKNGTSSPTTPTPSPYSVSFKTPTANATLSGSISASSACEVVGQGLKGVQFYLDGTALNKEGSAPWTCNIDTRKFADGAHILKAVATYADGKTGTTQIPVAIKNGSSAPSSGSVSFKTPAANGTLSGSISASSACEVVGSNIKGVQFYLDSTALNKEGSAPWTCNIDTRKFADGAHTLKAVATYSDGKTGTAQIGVNIENDGSSPSDPVAGDCANPSGGYEGFGRNTTGGAGKPVYKVTNLKDSGSGSLREALSQGNRCVVFDVGGTISLSSNLLVRGANVTIDGLTAPAPGITLKNRTLVVQGSSGARNVVLRGIRVRGTPTGEDAVRLYGTSNVVVDRVSISGAGDGALDVTEKSRDITLQWNILGNGGASHNVSLIKYNTARITVHHNLFINSENRSPHCAYSNEATSLSSEIVCDVRNNLIWNYYKGTEVRRRGTANVVNNYYYTKKASSPDKAVYRAEGGVAYVKGNYSGNGWSVNKSDRSTPFSAVVPKTTDAITAAHEVVAKAGARGPRFGLDTADKDYLGQISLD